MTPRPALAILATLAAFSLIQKCSGWLYVPAIAIMVKSLPVLTRHLIAEYHPDSPEYGKGTGYRGHKGMHQYRPASAERRSHSYNLVEAEDGSIVEAENGIDFATDDNWESHKDFDVLVHFGELDEATEFFNEDQCMGTVTLRQDVPKKDRPKKQMKECCEDLTSLKRDIRVTGASGSLFSDRPDEFDHAIMIGGISESCMELIYWLDGDGKVGSPCGHRCVRYDAISSKEYNEIRDIILQSREANKNGDDENQDDESDSDSDSSDEEEEDEDEGLDMKPYNNTDNDKVSLNELADKGSLTEMADGLMEKLF